MEISGKGFLLKKGLPESNPFLSYFAKSTALASRIILTLI